MAEVEAAKCTPHPVHGLSRLCSVRLASCVKRAVRKRGVEIWNVDSDIGIVDFENVLASQCGKKAGFVPRRAAIAASNQLQGDLVIAVCIEGPPNLPETAAANQCQQPVTLVEQLARCAQSHDSKV